MGRRLGVEIEFTGVSHEEVVVALENLFECEDNVVSGNLLVVQVESGSRGGYTTYDADMGGGLTHTGNYASARSNCTSLKGNTYSRFIQAGTTSGSTYTDASGTVYRCGTCDAAGANTSVTTVKFADKACVNMFCASDVACPIINGTYVTGSQRTTDATADSVITYIDLDADV